MNLRPLGLVLTLLSCAAVSLQAAPSPGTILVLGEGSRRELATTVRGEVEMVALDALLSGAGVAKGGESATSLTLRHGGHEVTLYQGKSLVAVDGDLRLLSGPTLREEGGWLIPVESAERIIGPLLGTKVEWRGVQRVLIVGNATLPRVSVASFVSGEAVRVVLESSERVPFRVAQEEGRVTVSILRDAVDVAFAHERLTGGIVDSLQFLGGRENVFMITLGRRFREMKAIEQDSPPRLVLEFMGPPTAVARGTQPAPGPAPSARPPAAPETRAPRTLVIDPGHGGDDTGAKGPGGTLEKDVSLALARKLRSLVVNELGLQVFLTRDRDVEMPLDDRTSIANNYKADLFISLHANASRARGAVGSEVYFLSYQASEEERRVALAEGIALAPPGGTEAGTSGDLSLILWDMAQAEHLEESSALASRIQEELAQATGSETRGVKQAPFRVLVGAGMPAVLVEAAFLSNPEEEKLLASDVHQAKIAGALLRGIARFEREHAARYGPSPGPSSRR